MKWDYILHAAFDENKFNSNFQNELVNVVEKQTVVEKERGVGQIEWSFHEVRIATIGYIIYLHGVFASNATSS